MPIDTTSVKVYHKAPGYNSDAEERIDNKPGVEKLEVGDLTRTVTTRETHGLGQGEMNQDYQGLSGVNDFTVSYLSRFGSDGLTKIHEGFQADKKKVDWRVEYETGNSDTVRAVVKDVTTGQPIGEFVKTTLSLGYAGYYLRTRA